MKKWKIIKETDVSPSKWFPVLQHTIELPNGTLIDDYFISRMGDVAMVLPITSKNEVVLVKQYKHGLGEFLIELPAGFQQKGKTIEETALAELEEETGIRTTRDNLIFLTKTAHIPTKTRLVVYCYLVKNLEFNSKQNLDVTENIELVTVSPKEALEMVRSGKIWVADTVAAILTAFLKFPEIFR